MAGVSVSGVGITITSPCSYLTLHYERAGEGFRSLNAAAEPDALHSKLWRDSREQQPEPDTLHSKLWRDNHPKKSSWPGRRLRQFGKVNQISGGSPKVKSPVQ